MRAVSTLVGDDRVHAEIYTDEDVFAEEMSKIFGRTWVYIGHESEIAENGSFKATAIGLTPVILTRDRVGQIHVLVNRCSHRGATLCDTERGKAVALRCKYHGWTFRHDGSLIGATLRDGYIDTSFASESFALEKVGRTASYRGFVFASLAESGPTIVEHLGRAAACIDLIVDSGLEAGISVRRPLRYAAGINWKVQLENSVDGYHAFTVHEAAMESLAQIKMPDSPDEWIRSVLKGASVATATDLGNGHSMLDQRPVAAATQRPRTEARPGGTEYVRRLIDKYGLERAEELIEAVAGEQINMAIFPNLVFIGQQVRIIQPRSATQTDVEVYFYGLDGAPPEFDQDRMRAHEVMYGPAGSVNPDDLELFRRINIGLHSGGWVDFRRGRGREHNLEDGQVVGQMTDEVPQRGMWKQWRALMIDEVDACD